MGERAEIVRDEKLAGKGTRNTGEQARREHDEASERALCIS